MNVDRPDRPTLRAGRRHGLTLVELVVVLAVLGLLASFALPRMVAPDADARRSKMAYMLRSFESGTRTAHEFWTARAQPPSGFMTVQGHPVQIVNGWPSPAGALGLLNASNPPPFVPVLSEAELEIRESVERPQCRFIYRAPARPGGQPEYVNELTAANCSD